MIWVLHYDYDYDTRVAFSKSKLTVRGSPGTQTLSMSPVPLTSPLFLVSMCQSWPAMAVIHSCMQAITELKLITWRNASIRMRSPRPKSPKGLKKHLWNLVLGDCNCFHINWSWVILLSKWHLAGPWLSTCPPTAAWHVATGCSCYMSWSHHWSWSHQQPSEPLPCCATDPVPTMLCQVGLGFFRPNLVKLNVSTRPKSKYYDHDISMTTMLLRGAIHIPHRQSTSCLRLPAASVGFFRSNWLRCWRWCYQAEVWPRRHSGR